MVAILELSLAHLLLPVVLLDAPGFIGFYIIFMAF